MRDLCEGSDGAVQRGISEFWRKNTSSTEAVELANLLRALHKVAGHLGPNVGSIEYTGMSHGGRSAIVIDPDLVLGQYPVPSEKVDYLVGLATHEALHRIEWSDRVWKLLEPAFAQMAPLARIGFQKIIYVGEDIYVDHIADQSIFGLYTKKAREKALSEAKERLRSGEVSIDALVYLWWTVTWAEETGDSIASAYRGPLATLLHLTRELQGIHHQPEGVTARCQRRADLYCGTWHLVQGQIASWKLIDKRLYWFPSSSEQGQNERHDNGVPNGGASNGVLPPLLAQELELLMAVHSSDITPIIRSIVGYENEDVVPTSRWDFNIPVHPVIDRRLVSRLRVVFQNYAERRKIVSRGLLSGKMDRRRLYRAPISGRCFNQVDRLPSLEWSVTLLIDASGSMRGNKWRMVEHTIANVHKALTGYRNHVRAYAYFEVDRVCMISQLIKGDQLLSVPPSGQTASGQALIAAAYFMSKERARKLMIHVTDGESNFGCDVQHGIDYCRQQHVNLVTLGCGCRDRKAMVRQYGKTIQFLDHFGQLPHAIERLLMWSFLYERRPHLWNGRIAMRKFEGCDDGT